MRLRIGILTIAVTAVVACSNSPLYRYSPEEAKVKCEEYGFERGTEGMARCLQALDDRRANAVSNLGSGLLFPRR